RTSKKQHCYGKREAGDAGKAEAMKARGEQAEPQHGESHEVRAEGLDRLRQRHYRRREREQGERHDAAPAEVDARAVHHGVAPGVVAAGAVAAAGACGCAPAADGVSGSGSGSGSTIALSNQTSSTSGSRSSPASGAASTASSGCPGSRTTAVTFATG